MSGLMLNAKVRLSIEVALAAADGGGKRSRLAEEAARTAGLTGAEIDALRNGTSFDFQLSKAVELALSPDEAHRRRARHAGLDDADCAKIEALAATQAQRRV